MAMRRLTMPRLGGFYGDRPATTGGGAAPSPDPNANLLLWSEEMQRAAWVQTGDVTVSANAGLNPGSDETTADDLLFGAINARHSQTTGIAATTGAAVVLNITLTGAYVRRSLTGTFDGTAYYLSLYIFEPSGDGSDIQLRLEIVGGFLVASLRDTGDDPTVRVWGWKLETPTLTAYVKREGT